MLFPEYSHSIRNTPRVFTKILPQQHQSISTAFPWYSYDIPRTLPRCSCSVPTRFLLYHEAFPIVFYNEIPVVFPQYSRMIPSIFLLYFHAAPTWNHIDNSSNKNSKYLSNSTKNQSKIKPQTSPGADRLNILNFSSPRVALGCQMGRQGNHMCPKGNPKMDKYL